MRLPSQIALIALLLTTGADLPATDQSPPIAVLWRLEEPSLIAGHPSTVLGAPQTRTASDGKAIHFNGVSDGLLLPVNPLEGLAQFTIEVLLKPETSGPAEQRFLHVQDELGSRALMEIRLTDEGWALDTFLYSLKTKSQCPLLDRTKLHAADRWTWVALVYADGHMAHYINGVKEVEGEVDFPPMLAGTISLGVRQNQVYWFKGSLREVRFHPVALASAALQSAPAK